MKQLADIWRWLRERFARPKPKHPHAVHSGGREYPLAACACGGYGCLWLTYSGRWTMHCRDCGYFTHRYRRVGSAVACWSRRQAQQDKEVARCT